MAHGFIEELQIQARDIDALNRFAKCTDAVDGGCLVKLTAPTAKGDNVWVATKPATGSLAGLAIAYNPENRILVAEGKEFAGLSADIRDYANVAGKTFDAFFPKKGDRVAISVDSADATTGVAGNYLEAKNGQYTWHVNASTLTSGVTALVIDAVVTKQMPKAGIGVDGQKMYICTVVAE